MCPAINCFPRLLAQVKKQHLHSFLLNLHAGMGPLDPLDDSNSLSDLARSMHHVQPFPAQSASDESASTHGPLVQLMHNISKITGPTGPAVGDDVTTGDAEVVNHAATVSLGRPQGLEEAAGSVPDPDSGAAMQHANGGPLSVHLLQSLIAGEQSGNRQNDGENGVTSIAGSSAQDFFKGRG